MQENGMQEQGRKLVFTSVIGKVELEFEGR
jgi:hypothetical protein